MIVVMQAHSNDETIEHVLTFLKDHGLSGHLSQGVERTVIGVLGAVVGSALVRLIEQNPPEKQVEAIKVYIQSLQAGRREE